MEERKEGEQLKETAAQVREGSGAMEKGAGEEGWVSGYLMAQALMAYSLVYQFSSLFHEPLKSLKSQH